MSGSAGCSDGDEDQQSQLREDELMALEAILPPATLYRNLSPFSGLEEVRLTVPVVLEAPITVLVRSHFLSSYRRQSKQHAADGKDVRQDERGRSNSNHSLKDESLNEQAGTSCHHIETASIKNIKYLPPIEVCFHLPPTYPTYGPPNIITIACDHFASYGDEAGKLSHPDSWKLRSAAQCLAAERQSNIAAHLKASLIQQWHDFKGEVIYIWYEYLREGNIIADGNDDFGKQVVLHEYIVERVEGTQFISPLATSLRSYDILQKRKEFEGERFGCGICLEDKRGGKCWRIADCGHVFCQECLTGYLSSMIREGYTRQASACPDPECVKARVAAENRNAAELMADLRSSTKKADKVGAISADELLHFVGPELVARLDRLRDKALASADPTAGYCPRPGCERLVRGDPADVGTTYEAMRTCDCGFIYCLYCNKAWHGKSPCNLVSSAELIQRYQQVAEGSSVRREMELKYGKANLERMVRTYEEEMQNRKYIESNTQKCPCCSVQIEKSMGCSHMTCRSCNTHFCYRCGTRLNPLDPYRHFNTPGMPCYQKLFDTNTSLEPPRYDWGFLGANDAADQEWEADEL